MGLGRHFERSGPWVRVKLSDLLTVCKDLNDLQHCTSSWLCLGLHLSPESLMVVSGL